MASKWEFLNIEESKESSIHDKLLEDNLLGMQTDKVYRLDEMMLAMSLGKGSPSPIVKRKGVVRDSYVNGSQEAKALIVANAIGSINGMSVMNEDLSKKAICEHADSCSNTGYNVLESYMSAPIDNRELYFIENILDKLFEENVENYDK